jgi:hypothetical protein
MKPSSITYNNITVTFDDNGLEIDTNGAPTKLNREEALGFLRQLVLYLDQRCSPVDRREPEMVERTPRRAGAKANRNTVLGTGTEFSIT